MTLEFHPIANSFPLMQGDEYEALKADIAANGLLEAIWLHPDGSVLDGRNRYRACEELGMEPQFRTWNGQGSLVSFVVSMNLRRRHLDSSQQATVAVEVLPMLEEEAKERMQAGGEVRHQGKERIPYPEESKGQARDQAAKLFQTNPRYVQDAKKLKREAPDLFEQVKAGELTIPQANRARTDRNRQPPPPLPTDKFSVIYADPPWSYDNSGFYESAASQYSTMSVEGICALPIADRAVDETVLFLWATNPLLPEALVVLKAWGFTYKTCFAWIKDRGRGRGWWTRSKHELILVGVREKTPMPSVRLDSCFEADRGEVHSRKPDEAYEMIEQMYPVEENEYIELFARETREGWTSWGNEL